MGSNCTSSILLAQHKNVAVIIVGGGGPGAGGVLRHEYVASDHPLPKVVYCKALLNTYL